MPTDQTTYRLVVCLDVEAKDLKEAYKKVALSMNSAVTNEKGFEWESSDEWFGTDGHPGDPDKLQEARMAFFRGE